MIDEIPALCSNKSLQIEFCGSRNLVSKISRLSHLIVLPQDVDSVEISLLFTSDLSFSSGVGEGGGYGMVIQLEILASLLAGRIAET